MARPFVVFADPIVEALRVLRGALVIDPDLAESGLTAHRTMPERTVDTAAPVVVVTDDGDAGSGYWPVSEDALIRVTVWASSPYRAHYLAGRLRAHLAAYGGDARLRGFTAATRALSATDPDDGSPLTSFTATARLRPLAA